MNENSKVRVWEETVLIPTYETGRPDKNPLFLEKRVYQGSSGKVYPHPVIDKLSDEKVEKPYQALFLENEYLKIMILPELGGRVQRAYDKKKNYDFVYYNQVIKPALVGLAGPWISGGIEFNWPQHHRPSTFDKVNYTFRENEDGSATVVCSEIEMMFHTKGETEFTLYPDRAYLELRNHLFNRTNTRQTFLWWANPAVAVNENYASIFPPDVTAVMDHGKRAVSTFPIATGTYYKVDYSSGVDISRYKNLPVPTSYMAAGSEFDFVGGYDYGVGAGILHVADHHISPGKKQWTWGCGEFGKAWDRNLTDEDGPYCELMTGCFTDNQPDFSFIEPMESKQFTQYFMPYHDLGQVQNASKELAVHVARDRILFYCFAALGECEIRINGESRWETFQCAQTYTLCCEVDVATVRLSVWQNGREILSYCGDFKKQEIPKPAEPAPLPQECATTEDLYLYGLHVEQYRHATRRAEEYYLEGLRRDKTDLRLNMAYGLLLLKKGEWEKSERYFRTALEKQNRSNPNFQSGEAAYHLGLSLWYQGRLAEAFDSFYKATWNYGTKANAYYFMALIRSRQERYEDALEFAEQSLTEYPRNLCAQNLKSMLLKTLGREYRSQVLKTLEQDCLDLLALYLNGDDITKHILHPNLLIDVGMELISAGFRQEAVRMLSLTEEAFPLLDYYRAYLTGEREYLVRAFADSTYCCFPNRPEDILVLNNAIEKEPSDFKAPYYLGNLLYDKERHEEAIRAFELSISRGADFATPYRNLALLCFQVRRDGTRALNLMETAFRLDPEDARVLYELDLLKKRLGISPEKRLEFLQKYDALVESRDDLLLEYITLLNLTGQYKEALHLLLSHRFHPWEGGEGKVPEQYVFSHVAIGTEESLRAALSYPESLGEGKLFGAQENRENYYLGKLTGERTYLEKASQGIDEPVSAMYYNDQPPETIFYQGMAWKELGGKEEAEKRFQKLISYAERHMQDEVTVDYFAVSLPDLLVFEEDLNTKNQLHCLFMKALGLYGMGRKAESREVFREALKRNPNAFQIATHYTLLFSLEERDNEI